MRCNKSLGTPSATLLAIVIVILASTPGASAQSKYKTLNEFTGPDGNFPQAGLVSDQAGNLYGTTLFGGNNNNCGGVGCGTVFELSPSSGGWTENVLYNFGSTSTQIDGIFPSSNLVFDHAGNLYGTTSAGGANGTGTVFELTPKGDGSWTESVLYSFCGANNCTDQFDGSSPQAGLIFDASGNLYGTTFGGGVYDKGTVFELTPGAGGVWTEKVLHSFQKNSIDGYGISAGLVFDALGNLYGTTMNGGRNRYGAFGGTVFQLTPNAGGNWTERVIYNFCSLLGCQDGQVPLAGLIVDSKRNLYGTTVAGGIRGESFGTVFELSPNGKGVWKEQVIHAFAGFQEGAVPEAGLTFDKAGNLYGTTFWQGNGKYCAGNGCGIAFKLVLVNGVWGEITLHEFTTGHSYSSLIFDSSKRHLYGTISGDRKTTFGLVFEVTP